MGYDWKVREIAYKICKYLNVENSYINIKERKASKRKRLFALGKLK